MAKKIILVGICWVLFHHISFAQCSVCTKTAEQLGEGPAAALNNAIVYLMFTPLLIMGFVGVRWWKREQQIMQAEQAGEIVESGFSQSDE